MADETVARALGVLRQGAIGRDHAIPLTDDETAWLGADARGTLSGSTWGCLQAVRLGCNGQRRW